MDQTTTVFAPLKLGTTVNYKAGFQKWINSSNPPVTFGKPTTSYAFTVVEAKATAITVSVSLATYLIFLIF